MFSASQWAPDLDNPTNKAFVAAYEKKYGYVPSLHSSHGFDAAQLIDSAVKAVNDDISDKKAVTAALEQADLAPVCGDLMYNTNTLPTKETINVQAVKSKPSTQKEK